MSFAVHASISEQFCFCFVLFCFFLGMGRVGWLRIDIFSEFPPDRTSSQCSELD